MLNINKNINLNGTITIEGQPVVWLNATISTDTGNGANVSKSINNQELYKDNKDEVRLEIKKFEEEVYKLEDELSANDLEETK